MTDTSPAADWPFTLGDPVRAVHFALDPGCPHDRPQSCPDEAKARQAIDAYRAWLAARPTADDRTLIDGQPRETGHAAHQAPHSPSGTPEGPATPEKAAGGRTAVRLDEIPDETLHAAIHQLARTNPPSFRALVARAGWTTEDHPGTGLGSRADSQDNWQDSTPDTETDRPVARADSVRTGQDSGLREQYAAALTTEHYRRANERIVDSPEGHCAGFADVVMAVRDRRLAQLAAGRQTWRAKAEKIERERDRLAAQVDQLTARLGQYADRGIANGERAEQAEATVARVRDLAHSWAILRTHGGAAYELLDMLDESKPEQPEVVHPSEEQPVNRAQQADERNAAEAAVARVRAECDAINAEVYTDASEDARGHRAAVRRIRAALDGAPAAPHPAEAERDAAYRERAHLLAWLAALHPANAVITTAADVDEDGWQLLYLLVGGWQMSWHIHPRDAALFDHVEHVNPNDPRAQWDGHSTPEKYERVQQHVRRIAADRP